MPYTNINDILNQNRYTLYLRNPITGKLAIPDNTSNLSDAQRTISNSLRRLQAVGVTPPPPNMAISALQTLSNILNFSGKVTRTSLQNTFNIPGLSEGVGNALKEANILSNHPFLRGALGFVGDIALDPLTYITLGTAGIAKGAAGGAAKTATQELVENLGKEAVERAAQKTAEQTAKQLALKVSLPFVTRTATIPIPGALSESLAQGADDITKGLLKMVEPVAAPLRSIFNRGGVSFREEEPLRKAILDAQERIFNIEREAKGLGHMYFENTAKRFEAIGKATETEKKMAAWLSEEGISKSADQGAALAKKWLSTQPKEVQERVLNLAKVHREIGEELYKLDEPLRMAGYSYEKVKNYIYHMYDNSPLEIERAEKIANAVQRRGGLTSPNKTFMRQRGIDSLYLAEKELGLKPVYDPIKLWGTRIYQSVAAHMGLRIQQEAKRLLDEGTGIIKLGQFDMAHLPPKGWVNVANVIPSFADFMKKSASTVAEEATKGAPTYWMHPDLARAIRNLDKVFTDNNEMQKLIGGLTKISTIWKSLVTTTPGYQVRNTIGNMLALQQADVPLAQQPKLLLDTIRIWSSPKDMLIAGPSLAHPNGVTVGEFLDNFYRSNLFGHGGVEELKTLDATMASIANKVSALDKGLAIANKITMPSHKLSEAIETNFKAALFLDKIRSGLYFDDAAAITRKYLFDYNDITPTERALRLVFPFYTYTRKELPILLEQIVTNPKIYIAQGYLAKEMQDAYNLEDKEIPDWLRQQLAVPLKIGNTVRMINLGLPTNMLGEINVSNGAFDAISNAIGVGAGMMNPLFRVPLEMATGTQLYSGLPIESRQYQKAGLRGITSPIMSAKAEYLLKQIPFPYTSGIEGPLGMMYNLGGYSPIEAQNESSLPAKAKPDALTILLNSLGMSSLAPQISPERQKAIQDIVRRNQLVDFITMLQRDLGMNVPTINDLNKQSKNGLSLEELLNAMRLQTSRGL